MCSFIKILYYYRLTTNKFKRSTRIKISARAKLKCIYVENFVKKLSLSCENNEVIFITVENVLFRK